MSKKNETPILLLSLLVTGGLIAGGFWWMDRSNRLNVFNQNQASNRTSSSESGNQSNPNNFDTGNNFASVKNVPTGIFRYGGSTSWAPIRLAVDAEIQKTRPEYRLRNVDSIVGSTPGIKSLIDGQLAFAQSSRPLTDEEVNRAKQRGFGLTQTAIAIDALAIAVNPSLNVPGITVNQLKGIYTGKIKNWNEIGGPNLPIQPISRRISDGGTVELFVQDILASEKFASNVQFASTTTEALNLVSRNPGAIYFASAPEVIPQCSIKPLALGRTPGEFVQPYQEPLVLPSACPGKRNTLNIEAFQSGKYPITRNLFVVVKQNGQIEQQAGNAYTSFLLTAQGQELISQAGFVKLR